MEEEKKAKNNNNKNIIIAIVVTIIICLIIFICYDKSTNNNKQNTNNNQEQENNNQNEEQETNILTDELYSLIGRVEHIMNIQQLQKTLPLTNINSIDNQEILMFAINQAGWNEKFTSQEIENIIKDFVGTEYKVKHENINCSVTNEALYEYNNNTKTYTFNRNHSDHESSGNHSAYTKYINNSIIDNTYTINFKITYSNLIQDEDFAYKYYKNITDAENDQNLLFECPWNENEGYYEAMNDEYFKTFENELPTTTFVFEKNNDGTFNLKNITVK